MTIYHRFTGKGFEHMEDAQDVPRGLADPAWMKVTEGEEALFLSQADAVLQAHLQDGCHHPGMGVATYHCLKHRIAVAFAKAILSTRTPEERP